MCRRFDPIPASDGQTDRPSDRQTDGIAIASTALAMRALLRAVKIGFKNATNVHGSLTLPGPTGGAYNTDRICISEKVIKCCMGVLCS